MNIVVQRLPVRASDPDHLNYISMNKNIETPTYMIWINPVEMDVIF